MSLNITLHNSTTIPVSGFFPRAMLSGTGYSGTLALSLAADAVPSFMEDKCFPVKPVDFGPSLGTGDATKSIELLGHKPIMDEHISEVLHFPTYDSLFKNVRALLTDWDFTSVGSEIKGEHNVLHKNILGAGQLFKWGVVEFPLTAPVYDGLMYSTYEKALTPLTGYRVATPAYGLTEDSLRELFDELNGFGSSFYDFDGDFPSYKFVNIISWAGYYHVNAWQILVTYDFNVVGFTDQPSQTYVPMYDLVTPIIRFTPFWRKGTTYVAGSAPSMESYFNSVDWYVPEYDMEHSIQYIGDALMPVTTSTEFCSRVGVNIDTNRYQNTGDESFQHFCATTHQYVPDFKGCAIRSATGAIDTGFETMSNNHIEALSELSDILGPLHFGRGVAKLLRSRSKGVDAFMSLLHLLADAKLLYSLAIAPTMDDALDVASKVLPIQRLFSSSDIYSWRTLNGKDSWDLELEELPVHVVMRSKVRCRLLPDSLLPYIFHVRSLGLLPTLSNLWDLVPLSFVLDWFFDVGTGLELLDSSAIVMAMDIKYCVHSGSLYTSGPRCNDFVPNSADDDVSYKTYYRWIDSSPPVIGPTRLISLTPMQVPDWFLASALVFKLIT